MKSVEDIKKRIQEELESLDLVVGENIEISSLDMVTAAVRLEKVFNIRFDLDEIYADSFVSLERLSQLVQKKILTSS